MKVLVSYPGEHLTGASRYAAAVSQELASRGHEVLMLVHGNGGAYRLVERLAPSVRVERVDTPNLARDPRSLVAHVRRLRSATREYVRFIRELGADVILAHSVMNVWAARASRETSVPLVASLHELPANYPIPFYWFWSSRLRRTARRIVVTTEEMARAVRAPALTATIPVGVSTEEFHPGVDGSEARAELLGASSGPLIVCPSHLMESKGQLDLVEALPRLVAEHDSLKVVFIGDTLRRARNEAYRKRIEDRARELSVESHVDLVGARADIAPFLAAADVVAYPSHQESFGLVPIEARAVGRPVVTADVGIARELAEEQTGVTVVPAGVPERLASAVRDAVAREPEPPRPLTRKWTIEGSVDGIERELGTAVGKNPASSSRTRRAVVLAMERVAPPSPEGVRSVNLAVTYYCNSRCTMCSIWELYRNDNTRAAAELTLPDIERIFASRRFDSLSAIALTGGEPFLRKDLVDIAGYFLERFPDAGITLPTDSVSPGLTIRRVREIIERYAPTKRRLSVAVSLDGTREAHNRQRGIDCFDKAIEVLETLAPMDLSLHVSFTITPLNASDVYATYRLARNLGADFSMQFGQGSSHYYGERSLADRGWREQELERVEGQIIDIADDRWAELSTKARMVDTADYFMRRMVDYHRSPRRIFNCYSGTHSCFIDPYGDVYPCLMLDKKLGNAKQDGFDKVWDGPIAREVRESIARKECHCWTPCEACPSLGRSLNPSLSALARLHRKRRASV